MSFFISVSKKTGLSRDGIEHIGECNGCEIKFAERLDILRILYII